MCGVVIYRPVVCTADWGANRPGDVGVGADKRNRAGGAGDGDNKRINEALGPQDAEADPFTRGTATVSGHSENSRLAPR
jgi:hypothetical protein